MDDMTMCLQENMELYAENERLYKLVNSLRERLNKPPRKNKGNEKRKQEMIALRDKKMWTLQEIADEYGLSRERVRQIVGNSGYENKKSARRKKASLAHPDLTNGEIAEILDISEGTVSGYRSGTRHAVKENCAVGVGVAMEDKYAEHLKIKGMDVNLMPHGHEFDALVNGWRVDFKYCGTQKTSPSIKNTSPVWRFTVRSGKKRRAQCDIYFCVTENDDVFIIPSDVVPPSRQQLVFCYPVEHNSKGKWQAYKDRYDLLETRKQEQQP